VQASATKTASEKVANMVGTFLTDDSKGFQIIKIPTTKTESKKGDQYGGHLFDRGQNQLSSFYLFSEFKD
jgi:hypothetical protein